jgi:hypothetical protein
MADIPGHPWPVLDVKKPKGGVFIYWWSLTILPPSTTSLRHYVRTLHFFQAYLKVESFNNSFKRLILKKVSDVGSTKTLPERLGTT